MLRFSIRDIFWVTLVIAMCLGWWIHYRAMSTHREAMSEHTDALIKHAERVQNALRMAEKENVQLEKDVEYWLNERRGIANSYSRPKYRVDWNAMHEPLPVFGQKRELPKNSHDSAGY